jgi:outer membrane PBP1 activator LpoA protein
MQRVFLWLSAVLALYASGFACATDEAPPAMPVAAGEEQHVPHIALLLPLKSALFGGAAEAVRQGFMAAAELEMTLPEKLPVRVYGCFDEVRDAAVLYNKALAAGALAVAGPLTRSGVGELASAQPIPVPTLALNVADGPPVGQMYFFGMDVESEARQVARLAMQQELRQAIVIVTSSSLSRRLQFAFEGEWARLGGSLLREIEFEGDPALLADIAELPDTAVFLATDAKTARLTRAYLPAKLPVFATSQVFNGNGDTLVNYDLNGIRFVDMPWLLQADHPAVMIYPRPAAPLSIDQERFYALGIDAFRLVQGLLGGDVMAALPLDGVSGRIALEGRIFQRSAIPAVFAQGEAHPFNTRPEATVPVFPAQAADAP